MFEVVNQFAAWCGEAASVSGRLTLAGMASGMFVAGLTASPLHCGPMCGGFVLGQVSDRMARLSAVGMHECHRLKTGLLAPYHLGRLTTYAALGAALGGGGLAIGWLGIDAGVFLLAAAVMLTAQALGRWRAGFALPLTRRVRGYRLGLALGFLPCGVLYAALAVAAATASPLAGALAMLCFGLGTIPVLAAMGVAGAAAGPRVRRGLGQLAPAILLVNAGLLAVLGVRLLTGS